MAMIPKKTYWTVWALCLIHMMVWDLQAQYSPFDPEVSDQAARILDEVSGFTDRSLYITGEVIKFSMRVQTSGLPDERDWSRIVYVDLISASGQGQAQGKFRIRNRMASGELRIPDGLLTGVYFLRAYTRWMRNRDPSNYVYLPIRIINPFSPVLDEAVAHEQRKQAPAFLSVKKGVVEISTGSSSFGRGNTVMVELSGSAEAKSREICGCLSIVPAAAKPALPLQLAGSAREGDAFQLDYLPDLFGVTLSGRVLREENDLALEGSKVHLTLLGDQPGYALAIADAYGRFSLSLPGREGKLEIFVQPEQDGGEPLEVRIDQDFDNRVLPLDFPSFTLSPQEIRALTRMARKVQLSRLYEEPLGGKEEAEDKAVIPFYGTPDFRLILDDYVLLPTLEEVFINLVPDVTPLIRRNRTELLISSVNPAISLFPPLLMIDQVPLFSMEQFLSISPGKISHIDVVNDVYLRGDMRYGGIINLWSLEGSMAGIDLPENSFFIDYHALYPRPEEPDDGYSPADHRPDTRNTILWMPDIQLERSASQQFSFPAPDYPGEYVIVFRGWDEAGQALISEVSISIK